MDSKRLKTWIGLFVFSLLMTLSIVFAVNNSKNSSNQDPRGQASVNPEPSPEITNTSNAVLGISDAPVNLPSPTLIQITPSPDPVLSDFPISYRKELKTLINWPEECERAFEQSAGSTGDYSGIEQYELETNKYVLQVMCTTGANQGSSLYYFYDKSFEPASFNNLNLNDITYQTLGRNVPDGAVWGMPSFDNNTKILTILNKYTGLGTCGHLAKYKVENKSVILNEIRKKDDCEGSYIDPEAWEKVYP